MTASRVTNPEPIQTIVPRVMAALKHSRKDAA